MDRPATQACALTGNRTSNALVHRPALNPLSHTSQGWKWTLLTYWCIFEYHCSNCSGRQGPLHSGLDRMRSPGPPQRLIHIRLLIRWVGWSSCSGHQSRGVNIKPHTQFILKKVSERWPCVREMEVWYRLICGVENSLLGINPEINFLDLNFSEVWLYSNDKLHELNIWQKFYIKELSIFMSGISVVEVESWKFFFNLKSTKMMDRCRVFCRVTAFPSVENLVLLVCQR